MSRICVHAGAVNSNFRPFCAIGAAMTRKLLSSFLPPRVALIGALALCGAATMLRAETTEVVTKVSETSASEAATGPVFTPSEEATFEQAFTPYDTPAEPAERAEAVDITEITPAQSSAKALGRGTASYYGRKFHGRRTANGERFDMTALTAAHKTLPFGSRVRVTNPRNGRAVIVRINDRGPFVRGRTIDLSRSAAEQIGIVTRGHGEVELELLAS